MKPTTVLASVLDCSIAMADGRTLTNWTVDPSHGHNRGMDNLYQAHPAFLALRPTLAWGFFLHSTWFSRFDVGATHPDILDTLAVGDECDYYVLYGPTPDAVVEKLTRLTGHPALPPLRSTSATPRA